MTRELQRDAYMSKSVWNYGCGQYIATIGHQEQSKPPLSITAR